MSIDMQLATTASLLRRGGSLDQLSTGLTLLGVLFGLAQYFVASPAIWGLACSGVLIVLGLWQKYLALRVAFDADLFQHLAASAQELPARTQALDQALTALGLQPVERGGRLRNERVAGALKLLRRQALLVAAQVLATLTFILASPWLAFAA